MQTFSNNSCALDGGRVVHKATFKKNLEPSRLRLSRLIERWDLILVTSLHRFGSVVPVVSSWMCHDVTPSTSSVLTQSFRQWATEVDPIVGN